MHSANFLLVSVLSVFVASKPIQSLQQRATVAIPGYDYIGCYTDTTSVRTFSSKSYVDDEMTIEKCAAACTGYTYFGTEYGRECFCGDSPAAGSVKVQEAYCSFSCPGDTTQTCGAGDHLTTYAITGTVPVNPGAAPTYGSLGCYTEATTGRALTGALFVDDQLTVEKCAVKCAGFKYFGLEYQRECFCGNDPLGSGSVKVSQLECPYNCGGDRSQSCGGDLRLNLWEFGAASVPEAGPETSYHREGCYTEAYTSPQGQGMRTLTGKQYYDNAMTVEKCADACAGFTYFGVEWATECYCGKTINTGSAVTDDAKCSFPCGGNGAEKCGAGDHLDLYKFGASTPPSPSTTSSTTTALPTTSSSSTSPTTSESTTTTTSSESTTTSSSSTSASSTSSETTTTTSSSSSTSSPQSTSASTTSESSSASSTTSSTTTTSSPSPTPTTTTTTTTTSTTTTTTTTTTTVAPALQTFALRVGNTSQNNARGQLFKVRTDTNGYIMYVVSNQPQYNVGSFYLEATTNRLKVGNLYVVQSSNLSLYSATASQVGVNNWYIKCEGPVILGSALRCISEKTTRTQFRITSNTASTNVAVSINDPATALGSQVSFDFIAEAVA